MSAAGDNSSTLATDGPKGIGGWLIFIAIGVVTSPISLGVEFLGTLQSLEFIHAGSGLDTGFRALILGEMVTGGLFLLWSVLNIWLFFRKRDLFPRAWIGLVWGYQVYFAIDLMAADRLAHLPITPTEQGQLIGGAFAAALWTAYLLNSRRVRNTFTRPTAAAPRWFLSARGLTTAAAVPFAAAGVLALAERSGPVTPREIANQASNAFVTVTAYLEDEAVASGSGFVVRSDGVVVTNLHVLQGADALALTLADGATYEDVSVLGVDEPNDLALLQVPVDVALSLSLAGVDDLQVGDPVYVLGNPLGMDFTFSDGLLSARRGTFENEQLQITAPISEGSSGGPVMNARGEVVGVAAAYVVGGQNLNLAIPARHVADLLAASGPAERFADIADRPAFAARNTVAGRQEEFFELWQTLSESAKAQLDGREPWEKQTIVRSWDMQSTLEEHGWKPFENEVALGVAVEGEVVDRTDTLPAGAYAALAVCDDDCLDLDITVLQPDLEPQADTAFDAYPIIFFDVDRPQDVTISTIMVTCAAENCAYLTELYHQ